MQTSLNFPSSRLASSSSSTSKKTWHSSKKTRHSSPIHTSVSVSEYQEKQKHQFKQQKSSTISTEEHQKKEQDSLHSSAQTNNNDDDDNDRSEEIAHTDGSSLGNQFKATRKAGYSVFFGEGDPRNRSEPVEGKQRRAAASRQRLAAISHIFSNVSFYFYLCAVMQRRNVAKGDKHTNNVGELMGVITALELANKEKNLTVFTDSEYVIKGKQRHAAAPRQYYFIVSQFFSNVSIFLFI
jgi:ribonuclease HI